VPCRIPSPDNKINLVLEVLVDPLEGLIHQREGGITTGCLSTVRTSRTTAVVAGIARTRVGLVEGVGMYIWRLSATVKQCYCAGSAAQHIIEPSYPLSVESGPVGGAR
jgi:hypothetical protein